MVMAAGLGTRLRPYADLAPKALTPVLGIPSIHYSLFALAELGIERVVTNVHHLADPVERDFLEVARARAFKPFVSDERGALLGSAGGLRHARPLLIQGPSRRFFYLNADVLCEIDLAALLDHHLRLRAQWGVTMTLAVFPRGPDGAKYRELRFDPTSSLLTAVGELQPAKSFFASAAVIEPDALAGIPREGASDFVASILLPELARKRVGVFAADGLWFDLGTPELWWRTHLALLERLETGALPRNWRAWIEAENTRVGERAWVRRGSEHLASGGIMGPGAYFDADGVAGAQARVGRDGVQYGASEVEVSRGISRFGLAWTASAEARGLCEK